MKIGWRQCGCCRNLHPIEVFCAAFPDALNQIPDPIQDDEFDHRRPFPGDNGVRWEPKTPETIHPFDCGHRAHWLPPQCSRCRWWRGGIFCKAFPRLPGIPRAIFEGAYDHRQPFDADNGVRWQGNSRETIHPSDEPHDDVKYID